MKKGFLINTFVLLISISALVISLSGKFVENKSKYVDIKELYEGFDMKKEYEGEFKKIQSARQRIIDSLELQLKILSQQIDYSKGKDKDLINAFQVRRQDYLNKKQQFGEDDDATLRDYDEKILKQLNQYVEEFGSKNDSEYIFGYSGGGEVLYGKKENNITKELIIYVNNRYKGGSAE
ncbi:MAG: outer rane chaperone Skp (OmpH) [Bacteroidetes bacterium]|jgi:outer membrane protein|nr:outer rane chaperone Skp (OmpH) [Bacteroidota bacterium]